MSQRKIKIGEKEKNYNLPSNTGIEQFVIKIHNEENSRKRSYYFFNMEETEWSLTEGDGDCIITVYGTRDNGEVLSRKLYKKPACGEIEELSSRPSQSIYSLNTFYCEVEENVPHPNVSNPVFKLRGSQTSDTNYYIMILKNENTKFIQLLRSENNEINDSTINLQSRKTYNHKELKLYKVDKTDQRCVVTAKANYLSLTTRNCLDDVQQLKTKAENYIRGRSVYKVIYLYRNKPSSHKTIEESNRTGIMAKYFKDNNGDRYSSINQNIKGLHFCATPEDESGALPGGSFFGDKRIKIYPEYLVQGCHLYFADFFCMRRIHWVTLVLTKVGSEEDKFCENRLVKLDIQNNPFFYNSRAGYRVTSLDVEILYTEDINLNEMRLKTGFQEETSYTRGKGGTSGGRLKNSSCSTCNLPRR